MKYRYSALPNLAFTEWDGDVEAVYAPTAAKTHLLSAAATLVLRALCQLPKPADAPELAQALAGTLTETLAEAPDNAEAINVDGEVLPKVDVNLVQQLLDGLYIAGLTHRHE